MDLPRLPIPPIAQDAVPPLGRDTLGVVNLAVLEVGEGKTLVDDAAFLLAELVLLRVGGVPDVVGAGVGDDEGDDDVGGEGVLGGVVESDVEGAVAVGEGHAGHVPEDEHEAEFLVVHVPARVRF